MIRPPVSRGTWDGRNCFRTREWTPSAPTRRVPVAEVWSEKVMVMESILFVV